MDSLAGPQLHFSPKEDVEEYAFVLCLHNRFRTGGENGLNFRLEGIDAGLGRNGDVFGSHGRHNVSAGPDTAMGSPQREGRTPHFSPLFSVAVPLCSHPLHLVDGRAPREVRNE